MRPASSSNENRLWPNPAQNTINVTFLSATEGARNYSIRNVTGALLKSGTMYQQKGTNSSSLSIKELPAGVYYLSIPQEIPQQPITFKFVKQ
jgi:hypothetical protein